MPRAGTPCSIRAAGRSARRLRGDPDRLRDGRPGRVGKTDRTGRHRHSLKLEQSGIMARIVAITGCPTGIAHTFMAAAALEKTAAVMGHEMKVETQGAQG